MRLHDLPFAQIKAGKKWVEIRLFDEKRQKIKEGDNLIFVNIQSGETLRCSVQKLAQFPDFIALYEAYEPKALGYEEGEKVDPADMLEYYTIEDVKAYGALAIELLLQD